MGITKQSQNLGWRKVKLGEVLSVSGGGTPSTHNSEYWNGDIPWFTPAEVSGLSGRFIEKTGRNISKKGLEHSSAKLMPVGSLLLTSRATIGDVVINKVPMATNQGFINIAPSKEVDQMFLFYWLKRNYNYFNQIAVGSTFPELIKSVFKEIAIELPELDNQKRIADILSAFDDKIELNNKISKNLEQMAQAIFKEWFVKFNFPVEFEVKSEKSKVKSEKLETICDIVYGKDLPTRNLKKYGFPVYGGNGMIGYSDKYLYSEPQIIIGCRGAYSGNIFKTEPKSFVTHNSLILKTKKGRDIGLNYLFYALQKSNVRSSVTGSAQPQITIAELNQVSISISDESLMRRFEDIGGVIENNKSKMTKENQKLAALRDLLLPKLMSGDILVNSE